MTAKKNKINGKSTNEVNVIELKNSLKVSNSLTTETNSPENFGAFDKS